MKDFFFFFFFCCGRSQSNHFFHVVHGIFKHGGALAIEPKCLSCFLVSNPKGAFCIGVDSCSFAIDKDSGSSGLLFYFESVTMFL